MRIHPFLKISLVLFSLVSYNACSSSNDLDPGLQNSLEEVVERYKEEFGLPGVVAGVWIPGGGQLIIENGVSDVDAGTTISQDEVYRIGSITKSFTVTLILQLAEQGLLSLDDPAELYLPGVENGAATLAELANMRSGIFNYTEDGDFIVELLGDLLRQWPSQALVDVADRNPPYFPPGADWHYSNTNTVILGMIAEQVTGRPLNELIQEKILNPLSFKATQYPTTPDLPEPFAHGYAFDPLEDVSFVDPSASAGSGAMISRLNELKTWAEALGTGELLSAESQAARIASLQPIVFSPCADEDPDRPKVDCPVYDRYGIGEISGWIGHTGEYFGYMNLLMYEPNSGAVVVIWTNRFGVGEHVPTAIFKEFAELLR